MASIVWKVVGGDLLEGFLPRLNAYTPPVRACSCGFNRPQDGLQQVVVVARAASTVNALTSAVGTPASRKARCTRSTMANAFSSSPIRVTQTFGYLLRMSVPTVPIG